jgi:hypothetical protein
MPALTPMITHSTVVDFGHDRAVPVFYLGNNCDIYTGRNNLLDSKIFPDSESKLDSTLSQKLKLREEIDTACVHKYGIKISAD